MSQDKGVIEVSVWFPWRLVVTLLARYVTDAHVPKEPPHQT